MEARKSPEHLNANAGPDFFCVGAQKAGTGWLYEQLRAHPDFWMPPLKELHYFDRMWRAPRKTDRIARARKTTEEAGDNSFLDAMEELEAQPEIDLSGYARLFASKGSLLSGDITPGYSVLPDEIIERIVQYFSNLKVMFLARDPVERAWSHLSMWVRHDRIDRFNSDDFDEVARNLWRPEVLARSHPSMIVARWRRHVPTDRLRVFFFDDLQRQPDMLRRSILQFLGADPSRAKLAAEHNSKARQEKLPLSNEMRAHLAQFFEKELKACAGELGGPAKEWPARYGF